jgi:hypothetical protein
MLFKLKTHRMALLGFAVFACSSSTSARPTVNSEMTPSLPARKVEFYYCEIDSELHRKTYPAIRLRTAHVPDYFEFIIPTGGSIRGKCYMLAMPDP